MTLARSLHLPSIAHGSAYARYARISEQEMSCLASWREGSARYLVGHLLDAAGTGMEGRNSPWDRSPPTTTTTTTAASGKDIRCFRYERHGGGTLHMAQSFGGRCMGLWSVDEGARTFKLNRGKIISNLGSNFMGSAKRVKFLCTHIHTSLHVDNYDYVFSLNERPSDIVLVQWTDCFHKIR